MKNCLFLVIILTFFAFSQTKKVSFEDLPKVYQVVGEDVRGYDSVEFKKVRHIYDKGDTLTVYALVKKNKKRFAEVLYQGKKLYISQTDSLVVFDATNPVMKVPETGKQGETSLFNRLLPYDAWESWVIVLVLGIIVYYGFSHFEAMDRKINELTGQVDRRPGNPWYILVAGLLPAAIIISFIFFPETSDKFLNQDLKNFEFPDHFAEYFLSTVILANIGVALFAIYDSFKRVGFPFAFLRILIIYIGMAAMFIVGLFASILIVVILGIMLFLMLGSAGLSAAAAGAEQSGSGIKYCSYCNGTGRDGQCNHCHGTGRLN